MKLNAPTASGSISVSGSPYEIKDGIAVVLNPDHAAQLMNSHGFTEWKEGQAAHVDETSELDEDASDAEIMLKSLPSLPRPFMQKTLKELGVVYPQSAKNDELRAMLKEQIEARVAEMLKLVHMTQYAKRKPHQLSGGQQALALAERLAGSQGLQMIAVLIGVCVPLYNVAAVWPMARHAQRGFLRELVRNPLILATASGLVVNLLGFSVPDWSAPTLTRIGASAIVLGLMAAGAGMQFGHLSQAKTLTTAVLAIRHLLLPLMALGLAKAFGLTPVQSSVLLAFSALPTASSAYVLAARMGYNGGYVAGLVTLSTLLGLVSLPFALGLLA